MKGTEKQIKWAEDIKAQAINSCQARIDANTAIGCFADETEMYRIMINAIEVVFAKVDDAAKIIDKRYMFDSRNIESNIRQALTLIKRGDLTIEQFAAKNGVTR